MTSTDGPTPPTDHRRGALNELVAANDRSAAAMMGLVDEVRRDADLRDRKVDLLERSHRDMRRLLVLVAAGLVVILTLGITNAVNLLNARRNAAATAAIAKDTRETNKLLFDCLNSQGECGRRNAQANKQRLDEIKRYNLVLVHCSRSIVRESSQDYEGDKLVACITTFYKDGPTLKGSNR
jgi:hypothetical protein